MNAERPDLSRRSAFERRFDIRTYITPAVLGEVMQMPESSGRSREGRMYEYLVELVAQRGHQLGVQAVADLHTFLRGFRLVAFPNMTIDEQAALLTTAQAEHWQDQIINADELRGPINATWSIFKFRKPERGSASESSGTHKM
ncbi:MAG TPA: hypothetical protein VLF93_06485 [Candidatus Saccharimonadales bacterium]|nr:hypothetical protein [Candidatus Saccharimonadales bacterium]